MKVKSQSSNKGLHPLRSEEKVQIFDMLGIDVITVGTGLDLSLQLVKKEK
ncbi:MAG: hypothetical protein KIT33_08385 [Candidatus Kapabacteria bacterium]|nr:hypothetical protein [Ignavibacteriota bacterium]MCW5884972.1 hypothetical protein [Candidatus Kapabacteria bacterium]